MAKVFFVILCCTMFFLGSDAKESDNSQRCPKAWSYYHVGANEYCMKVFTANQAILRQQADDQCKTHGSNLLSLHSTKEENFMRALMAFESSKVQDLTFWIGLRCHHNSTFWPESKQMLPIDLQVRITSCIFSWSDNSGSGNYRNWVMNSLTDNAAQSDKRECAAYSELDDGWVRAHCDSERHRGYVCKKKLGEESQTTKSNDETSSMPTPSASNTTSTNVPDGSKIMIIGGHTGQNSALETMETYVPDHPEQNSVSDARLKFGGHCLVAGLLGGHIIAAGGWENQNTQHTRTEEFIPSQNRWKVLDGLNMLWYAHCPGYVTYNDMLYLFGGASTDYKAYLASAQRLNWQRKRWEPVMHMPQPRGLPAALVYKDHIYIAGGANPWTVSVRTLYKYSPQTDSYTELEPMDTPRFGLGFAVFNGIFYACGGNSDSKAGTWNPIYLKTCEVYHPVENYWSSAPSLINNHYGFHMFNVNGKLLALGGLGNTNDNQVEQYDPQAKKWVAKTTMKTGRRYFAAVVI